MAEKECEKGLEIARIKLEDIQRMAKEGASLDTLQEFTLYLLTTVGKIGSCKPKQVKDYLEKNPTNHMEIEEANDFSGCVGLHLRGTRGTKQEMAGRMSHASKKCHDVEYPILKLTMGYDWLFEDGKPKLRHNLRPIFIEGESKT